MRLFRANDYTTSIDARLYNIYTQTIYCITSIHIYLYAYPPTKMFKSTCTQKEKPVTHTRSSVCFQYIYISMHIPRHKCSCLPAHRTRSQWRRLSPACRCTWWMNSGSARPTWARTWRYILNTHMRAYARAAALFFLICLLFQVFVFFCNHFIITQHCIHSNITTDVFKHLCQWRAFFLRTVACLCVCGIRVMFLRVLLSECMCYIGWLSIYAHAFL